MVTKKIRNQEEITETDSIERKIEHRFKRNFNKNSLYKVRSLE